MARKRIQNRETVLGVVCAHNRLSLTFMRGGTVVKDIWVDVGDNIAEGSTIKAPNLLAALIKDTMKANQIRCRRAAYAIPGETVFTRTITIPEMNEEQIRINVPFEFRDFIQGELKEYVFDYVYVGEKTDGASSDGPTMTLFAAAVPRTYLNDTISMFKQAGLKLVKATPETCTFEALLTLLPDGEERMRERCFLDIGQGHSRMLIYRDGRYKLMHMIDLGVRRIVQTIADEMNVDMHLAETYLRTQYEGCDTLPAVQNVYKDISLEVLKGINFYEVSDMSARLGDVTICGGGAMIAPLVELLKNRISMNVTTMDELLPDWNVNGSLNLTATSLGLVVE